MKMYAIGQTLANNRTLLQKHMAKRVAGLALCTGLLLSSCQAKNKELENDIYQKENVETTVEPEETEESQNQDNRNRTGDWILAGLIGGLYLFGIIGDILHPENRGWAKVPD